MVLDRLSLPVVQAPLGGGASTPQLSAAVAEAGGLGVLAWGYKSLDAAVSDLAATRSLTSRPLGVNVFVPGDPPADASALAGYMARLRSDAERAGVALGEPRHDDDRFDEKVGLLLDDPVAVVSCTFGCPPPAVVEELHRVGSEVWLTVTTAEEARAAA